MEIVIIENANLILYPIGFVLKGPALSLNSFYNLFILHGWLDYEKC
jgi:hypothetical protein